MSGIYKITSPSGKIYIGSSSNIKRREREYRTNNKSTQPRLRNSFKKYGYNNHKFEVIHECSIGELFIWEYHYGIKFDVLGKNGLNCRLPKIDDSSVCMSDETKAKIGIANKGRKRPDLSVKNKLRTGFTASDETKLKMRLSQTGRTHPQSVKDKIKKSHLGKVKSAEHCKNLSISKLGSGKKVINKITGEVFINMKSASESLNKNPSYLSHRFKAGYNTDFELIQ